jgi:uncharacterized protein YbbK (DUF523 family)
MIQVLVSACLLGEKVRYNGADSLSAHPVLRRWLDEGRVVPFCPELAGGLGVPRPPAEIQGKAGRTGGQAVLDGVAHIVTAMGVDVTDAFVRGATLAADAARARGVRVAILKDGSPSCGSSHIADGSFSGTKVAGHGVTAALLERAGVRVFSERQIDQALDYLRELEGDDQSGPAAAGHDVQ